MAILDARESRQDHRLAREPRVAVGSPGEATVVKSEILFARRRNGSASSRWFESWRLSTMETWAIPSR